MTGLLAAEIAIRVAATAVIVVGVTLSVERLGPLIGGALAGLPIVIGPGFFFIARQHGAAFTADAAAASLLSLCATEAFLLAYAGVAARHRPALALGAATLAWMAMAALLSTMPPRPFLALALFVAAAGAARGVGRRFLRPVSGRRAPGGHLLLLARGLAAGLLVAAATLGAHRLGATWAGLLVTYPIGFSIVAITIHQRLGAGTVIATLHAAMLGVGSLAAFSLTLALAIERAGPAPALAAALAASLAVTSLLAWRSRRGRPGAG
jgi:hypothetical protein